MLLRMLRRLPGGHAFAAPCGCCHVYKVARKLKYTFHKCSYRISQFNTWPAFRKAQRSL